MVRVAAETKMSVTGVPGGWSCETRGNKANAAVVTRKRNKGRNGVLLRGIRGVAVTCLSRPLFPLAFHMENRDTFFRELFPVA